MPTEPTCLLGTQKPSHDVVFSVVRRARPVHLRVDRVYTPLDRIDRQPVLSLFCMFPGFEIYLPPSFPRVSFPATRARKSFLYIPPNTGRVLTRGTTLFSVAERQFAAAGGCAGAGERWETVRQRRRQRGQSWRTKRGLGKSSTSHDGGVEPPRLSSRGLLGASSLGGRCEPRDNVQPESSALLVLEDWCPTEHAAAATAAMRRVPTFPRSGLVVHAIRGGGQSLRRRSSCLVPSGRQPLEKVLCRVFCESFPEPGLPGSLELNDETDLERHCPPLVTNIHRRCWTETR